MSEQHVGPTSQMNGPGATPTAKTSDIATSDVEGTVVTFTMTNGDTVSLDVAKLAENVKLEQAMIGARMSLRLSFQKMTDPAKVTETLRNRVARMNAGELTSGTRRHVVKQPDDLVQALANLKNVSTDIIENKWLPNYFASKDSGCTTNIVKGKPRVYGKKEARAKLRLYPNIKAELERLAKTQAKSSPVKNLDLDSITI